MPTETTAPTVDKLTRIYIKIRDARTQLASTFKDEDAVLSAQLDTVKAELLKYCADNGVESIALPKLATGQVTGSRCTSLSLSTRFLSFWTSGLTKAP